MATVYVVREGKVRGEGRYAGRKGTFCSGWGDPAHAWRFGSRARAKAFAVTNNGRVVRLVTLSEQLRRAKKRIAEWERAPGYYSGRADERAAVVAWLERSKGVKVTRGEIAMFVECGEHVKGGG